MLSAATAADDQRNRHGLVQVHPGEVAQIARAGAVIHHARDQKQRRLVKRVGKDADDERLKRLAGVLADQHHQCAELADGGVGEQAFEIVLAQANNRHP